jgi:hypothetical protein
MSKHGLETMASAGSFEAWRQSSPDRPEGVSFEMALTPDGQRFRCWSCNAGGTSIDWIMLRDKLSVLEAAKKLDPTQRDPNAKPKPDRDFSRPPAAKPTLKPWQDPAWQSAVEWIVYEAEGILWSCDGAIARDWLAKRRISEWTAHRFRLGFLPEDVDLGPVEVLADRRGSFRTLWARWGIAIPWLAPGAFYSRSEESDRPRWVGCNVRRLIPDV